MKTKIDWCDWTWNPASGCTRNCPYCYARKIARRFPKVYPFGFKPTFYDDRYNMKLPKKPKIIFVGSMFDIFNNCQYRILTNSGFKLDARDLWNKIVDKVRQNPQHFFVLLSKNKMPDYALKRPSNMLAGFTLTNETKLIEIGEIRKYDFINAEPFDANAVNHTLHKYLFALPMPFAPCWLIIGRQTNPSDLPKSDFDRKQYIHYVEQCIKDFKSLGIPVFVKEPLRSEINLQYTEYPEAIQKFIPSIPN